jgi:hypothetical protein
MQEIYFLRDSNVGARTADLIPGTTVAPGLRGNALELKTEECGLRNSLGRSALLHGQVDAIHLSPRSPINPGMFF